MLRFIDKYSWTTFLVQVTCFSELLSSQQMLHKLSLCMCRWFGFPKTCIWECMCLTRFVFHNKVLHCYHWHAWSISAAWLTNSISAFSVFLQTASGAFRFSTKTSVSVRHSVSCAALNRRTVVQTAHKLLIRTGCLYTSSSLMSNLNICPTTGWSLTFKLIRHAETSKRLLIWGSMAFLPLVVTAQRHAHF